MRTSNPRPYASIRVYQNRRRWPRPAQIDRDENRRSAVRLRLRSKAISRDYQVLIPNLDGSLSSVLRALCRLLSRPCSLSGLGWLLEVCPRAEEKVPVETVRYNQADPQRMSCTGPPPLRFQPPPCDPRTAVPDLETLFSSFIRPCASRMN
jgi:hypothetical protein